ncbi:MAG: hypothetical protein H6873_05100 [Hyphomicrobiaceae bacterium]|nr:hypothetical protein [Hyphomicrobiaceae bacterium]
MTGSPNKAKRSAPISLRVSDAERQALDVRAGNLPLSTYIRGVLFDGNRPSVRTYGRKALADRAIVARILSALGKASLTVNLAALADAAQSGSLIADEDTVSRILEACDDLAAIRAMLLRALGKQVDGPEENDDAPVLIPAFLKASKFSEDHGR